MKIRTRVAAIVLGTMALGVAASTVVGTNVLSRGFEDIEADDAREDLAFARSLVDTEVDRIGLRADILARTATARALLDDPHGHPWLGSQGLTEEMSIQRVEVLLVVDGDGHVVLGGSLDGQTTTAVPAQVVRTMRPGGVLDVLDDGRGRRGLVAVGDRVLVAASVGITARSGVGPPRGALLVGRWFDQDLIQQWSNQVDRTLQLRPTSSEAEASGGDSGGTVTVEGDQVVAQRILPDVAGDPVAVLSIRQDREIVEAGRFMLTILLVVVIATLGIAAIVLTPAIDAVLLRRLRGLTQATGEVGKSGRVSERIEVEGKDEVTELAHSINGMLASLERAHQEQELRNVELVDALEGKDRFVSTVAHELRTPITALKGLALTLMRADGRLDGDKQQELLSRLAERADSMEHLVEELLTMSRLAAGKITASPAPIDLGDHLATLLDDLATVLADIDTDVSDVVVVADPDHLSRILINLLENARRYGGPPIEVHARHDGDQVRVAVVDHGNGIARLDAERLFERFEQMDTSSAEGLGLGLSIVRSLAELNGGDVACENTPGGGATFVVRLPAGSQEDLVLHEHIKATSAGG